MHSCSSTHKRIKCVHVRGPHARPKSSLFNIGQMGECAYNDNAQISNRERVHFGMIDAFYILPSPEAYTFPNNPQFIRMIKRIISRERLVN